MRQRVAGDGPRTDQNNDGKEVKRAEVTPVENFPGCPWWLPFCCLRPLVVRPCVWVLVLCLFGPSRCWVLGAGWRSRVPWPLPSWLAAAPVFLVPASVLAFVRKGDVKRHSLVYWQYWSVDIVGVFLRWYILWFTPPPHNFDAFCQSVSTRFQPTGGGRWKNLRLQSTLSGGLRFLLCLSLVSAFASIVWLFQPTL